MFLWSGRPAVGRWWHVIDDPFLAFTEEKNEYSGHQASLLVLPIVLGFFDYLFVPTLHAVWNIEPVHLRNCHSVTGDTLFQFARLLH